MSVFRKRNNLAPAYDWRGTAERPGILVHYQSDHRLRSDTLFWSFLWVALLLHLHQLIPDAPNLPQLMYRWLLIGSYAFMFLLPAWLLSRAASRLPRSAQLTIQVALAALVHLFLQADHLLWSASGQHLTQVAHAQALEATFPYKQLPVLITVLSLPILLRCLASLVILFAPRLPLPPLRIIVLLFVAATSAERLGYALAHHEHNRSLLRMAEAMPLHQPTVIDDHLKALRSLL